MIAHWVGFVLKALMTRARHAVVGIILACLMIFIAWALLLRVLNLG